LTGRRQIRPISTGCRRSGGGLNPAGIPLIKPEKLLKHTEPALLSKQECNQACLKRRYGARSGGTISLPRISQLHNSRNSWSSFCTVPHKLRFCTKLDLGVDRIGRRVPS
jgi:hypothetical protein